MDLGDVEFLEKLKGVIKLLAEIKLAADMTNVYSVKEYLRIEVTIAVA